MKQTGRSKGIASVAVAKKAARREANDTLDRGVIMRAYDGKGKVDKSFEKRIVHVDMLKDFKRVPNTDHSQSLRTTL